MRKIINIRLFVYVCALFLLIQTLFLGVSPRSEARSLTDAFIQGFAIPETGTGESLLGFFNPDGTVASQAQLTQAAAAVAPAIAAAVSQSVTQQFPLASVAPAFTYRYNSMLSIYERSTGVPGPLFSERALTLGRGQLNFSVGYSYVDFDELNGTDMDNISGPALINELYFPDMSVDGIALFPFSLSQIRTRIDLQAHVIVPAVRYGITDNWDISFTLPILNTFIRVRNEVRRVVDLDGRLFNCGSDCLGFVNSDFTNAFEVTSETIGLLPYVRSQRPAARLAQSAASSTGIGDISLRTKYRFWRTENGGAALGLNLLLPTGDVDDFQGTDETHVSPFLILSQVMWDRFEPHVNVGFDFNADDVDRSAFIYAIGATLLVWDRLGFSVDFIGRSEFGRFPVDIPPAGIITGSRLNKAPSACTTSEPCNTLPTLTAFPIFPEQIKRNDIDDFSFGLRYALGTSGSIFFGGIIPINRDGFRSDFIPSGGVEYSF